jgi:pyrroloquinoline quinone biosynthesis protein B
MKIRVLGSAAGGGFPQWNCNCRNCSGVRSGQIQATARTQSSIAVSTDERHWVVFNTSPDIRAQLDAFPAIQPKQGLRDTGIAAIVFMDSQIDHTTGLLMLREGCPHEVYCTDCVYEDLTTGFPILRMLEAWNGGINRHRINAGEAFVIPAIENLTITPVFLTSKAPPYSPHRNNPQPGDNIGVVLQNVLNGKTAFYAPGLGAIEPHLIEHMAAADCLLVDGTFWCEDEMAVAGVGTKLARQMGHLPQSGHDGMIQALKSFPQARKILIHINNTNPILDEQSAQRRELTAQNIEVAFDGMEIEL